MFSGKIAVIAGGSTGLGLEIARAFASRGAQVVLLARNQQRLDDAVAAISETDHQTSVTAISVDLCQEEATRAVVAQISEQMGQIDFWVNAVGQSIRTSFADCGLEKYRELMEQNFFASVNSSLAAMPELERTGGSLVNIGSLAAKTAWPFLAPYVTSKHALAGFAKQIRLEGPENVHYLFLCPGPIASLKNEVSDRYNDQTANLPESAKKPGGGAPVKAIDPKWLAEQILVSCEKRRCELVVPFKSRLLFLAGELWPNYANKLIRRFSR